MNSPAPVAVTERAVRSGVPVEPGSGLTFCRERRLRTAGPLDVIDITDEVASALRASGVRTGIACAYSAHTTCSVRVSAGSPALMRSWAAMLERLVPRDAYYAHDDLGRRTENLDEWNGAANGHAHCMAMLVGPAGEAIPVEGGELTLGAWQRVLFIELDRARDRRWLVTVVGSL